MPRVFVSAGESSGDRHLGAVLHELHALVPDLELAGLGGDCVAEQGVRCLAGLDRLSVLGFWDVARRLPDLRRVFKSAASELASWKPDLAVFVDYPGFNLRLAAKAKSMGIPVVYYIAPQVWAWKRERRPGIAKAVDDLLVVFPFEEPLFSKAGIHTIFVGHPLMEAPPPRPAQKVRDALGGPKSLLGLFPGSRPQEVKKILPVLVGGTQRLRDSGVCCAVSVHKDLDPSLYSEAEARGCRLWTSDAASLASAGDAALVASGTATLEVGLLGTPMGVVYKTNPLNAFIARRMVKLDSVGLVNIVAGGTCVPELLQGNFTEERTGVLAERLLFDENERRAQQEYLSGLASKLGGPGASRNTARHIAARLGQS